MPDIIEHGSQKRKPKHQGGRKLVCQHCESVMVLRDDDKIGPAHHPFVGERDYNYEVVCPDCGHGVDFWGISPDHGLEVLTTRMKDTFVSEYDFTKVKNATNGISLGLWINWAVTIGMIVAMLILFGEVF